MPRVVTTRVLSRAELAAALEPWDGLFRERAVGDGCFAIETGPVTRYRRTVTYEPVAVETDGDLADRHEPRRNGRGEAARTGATAAEPGSVVVTQTTDYSLTLPFFLLLYALPVRRQLRRLPLAQGTPPWWAPPEPIEASAARALCALAILSLVGGFLAALLTQTMAFAGDEFGIGTAGQGVALAVSRIDILIAVAVAAIADRIGRRKILFVATVLAVALTAAAALSPSLAWLVAIQIPARGLTAGVLIVIPVFATEIVPARCRAYALSVLFLIGAFGAGQCVASLPLADLGERAWRLSYLIPVLYLPLVLGIGRLLPESRRFQARNPTARLAGHGRRLALLLTTTFLIQVFASPASQLQNTFLRDERGFSASQIAVFILLTSTPGGLGVVVGGRLADLRGRRIVGATAVVGGVIFAVLQYSSTGWSVWTFSALGATVAAAGVPALSVYGPELFPTAVRGKANGMITAASRAGAVTGLLAAGALTRAFDRLGIALAILAIAPLAVAVLILVAYPETAGVELEDLNPEDPSQPTVRTYTSPL